MKMKGPKKLSDEAMEQVSGGTGLEDAMKAEKPPVEPEDHDDLNARDPNDRLLTDILPPQK